MLESIRPCVAFGCSSETMGKRYHRSRIMAKARFGKAMAVMLMALTVDACIVRGASAQDSTSTTAGVGTSGGAAPIRQPLSPHILNSSAARIRKSHWLAYQLASYEWLDKVAEADPSILAAICSHPGPARVLAGNRHLNKLAAADHLLCRRICRWRRAADVLVRAPYADVVIGLDPEGFVMAMDRDPAYAKVISSHRMFYDMIDKDPDLGRQIAEHIR
jgi:hypothetical protein